MKLLILVLLLAGFQAQAALDCAHLDLRGNWNVKLDPSLVLGGMYDEATLVMASGADAQHVTGQKIYLGKDSFGIYFQAVTQMTMSLDATCKLKIQRISTQTDIFRNFDEPVSSSSTSYHAYAPGEATVSYQLVESTSTPDELNVADDTLLSR
jgi:hypothetical protein